MIRFGPSGNSESFYEEGYKTSVQMPNWLKNMGLSAYEYQCNKGVKISKETAEKLGEEAKVNDIYLSIHAPYYISMSSVEEEKRKNSIRYVLESLQAAKWMGAKRVVVHTGGCAKITREQAMIFALEILKQTIIEADSQGLGDITICPELLGKLNQLGSFEEIMEMCKLDERLIPCIDFGHLHARGIGAMNTPEDFTKVMEKISNELGEERLKKIHIHFSRIEYTSAGEKKHWTLADTEFGPEFEHLAEAIVKFKMEPVIICESRGNMAEDAVQMMKIYEDVLGR